MYFREFVNITLCNDVGLRSEEDITSAVKHFNTVQNAAWASTPFCERAESKLNYSSIILEKISEKRRMRRCWQRSRFSSTKTRLNHVTKELNS